MPGGHLFSGVGTLHPSQSVAGKGFAEFERVGSLSLDGSFDIDEKAEKGLAIDGRGFDSIWKKKAGSYPGISGICEPGARYGAA